MRVDEFDYKLPKELISLKTLRERRDESPLPFWTEKQKG